MAISNMKQFLRDRDNALLSLDKEKIVAYCNKYGVPIPDNELVFWAGVHKGIIAMNASTAEQKRNSAMWLVEHGFKPGFSMEG